MMTDPRKKKKPLDGYGTVTEPTTAPKATAPHTGQKATPATGTLTDAQKELQAAYGVHIGADGSIQKGTATDQAYQEAVNRYLYAESRDQINEGQALADEQYDADVQRLIDTAAWQREELARSRDQSQREAGILMGRLGRYLGNVQRVSGTAGSGAADADAIRRYNEVIRSREAADRAYDSGMTDVAQTEMETRAEMDMQKQYDDAARRYQLAEINRQEAQGQINIDNQFRVENQAASTQQYGVVSEVIAAKIEQLASKWGDGKISEADMQELRTYAESVSGGLTEQDRRNLGLMLDSYAGDVRSAEEAKMVEAVTTDMTVKNFSEKAKSGRNILVHNRDGNPYKVQIAKVMTEEDDPNVMAAAKNVPIDTVFAVGNNLYVRLSENDKTSYGTVVKLEKRTLDVEIASGYNTLKKHIGIN